MIEKFPHDILISLESASELSESTLSSSVSSGKATGSPIANDLKSRRRLTEIIEDVRETPLQSAASDQRLKEPVTEQEPEQKKQPVEVTESVGEKKAETLPTTQQGSGIPRQSLDNANSSPSDDQTATIRSTASPEPPIPPRNPERRTAKHISNEPWTQLYRPKVKLAPRPSLENRHSNSFERPVSTLPAGIRLGKREVDAMPRPQTQQVASRPFYAIPNVNFHGSSAASAYNHPTFDRPTSRAGSALTAPANARFIDTSVSSTPEKQRLMKALQRRKKLQSTKARAKEVPKQSEEDKASRHLSNGNATGDVSKFQAPHDVPNETAVVNGSGRAQHANTHHIDPLTSKELPTGSRKAFAQDSIDSTEPPNGVLANQNGKLDEGVTEQPESKHVQSPTFHDPVEAPSNTDSVVGEMVPSDMVTESMPAEPAPPADSDNAVPPSTRALSSSANHLREVESGPGEEARVLEKRAGPIVELTAANLAEVAGQDPQELPNEQRPHTTPVATSVQQVSETKSDRKKQKPPPLAPLKPEDISRAPSLSDDSLLDELQSATVEEAKSVSLSKTPTTPFSPTSPRRIDTRRSSDSPQKPVMVESSLPSTPAQHSRSGTMSRLHSDSEVFKASKSAQTPPRASSNPMKLAVDTQAPDPLTALPTRANTISPLLSPPDTDRPSSKKSTVSSLISQRIKAFENFSSSTSHSAPTKVVVTPQIVTLRKTSLNTPPTSAGGDQSRNASYFAPHTGYPTPSPSPQSFSARLFKSNKPNFTQSKMKETPVSVSTAVVKEISSSSIESGPAAVEAPQSPSKLSKRSSFFNSKCSKPKSTTSVPSVNSFKDGATLPRAETSSSRISISSRRSSTEVPRPIRSQSSDSVISDSEKKESKGKRLFKRLSNIGSTPRRAIAQTLSPTISSQTIPESQEPAVARKWSGVTVGAVNAQFPDTLVSYTW